MMEIRMHGRGGQGSKVLAHILSRAFYISGEQTQDFAIYGAERRGAPVASFCRVDTKPILERGYIDHPDYILVMDQTLFEVTDVLHGLKEDGRVIINSPKPGSYFRKKYRIKQKVFTSDITKRALKITGHDIPNVGMAGFFVRISDMVKIEDMEKAVQKELNRLPPEIQESNIKLARKCYITG